MYLLSFPCAEENFKHIGGFFDCKKNPKIKYLRNKLKYILFFLAKIQSMA